MTVPHVAFDLRCLFGSNGRRGIGVFSLGLARALAASGRPVTFLAPPELLQPAPSLPSPPIPSAPATSPSAPSPPAPGALHPPLGAGSGSGSSRAGTQIRCQLRDAERAAELGLPFEPCDSATLERLAAAGPTVFHSASLYEFPIGAPVIPEFVTRLGLPVTATWYDAIPYAEPDRYQPTPQLQAFYAQRAVLARSCDHLLAISDFAAAAAVELLGVSSRRVSTVGVGVGAQFRPPVPGAVTDLAAFGITRPYAVCVAGNDPRKNVAGLTAAWHRLPAAVRAAHQLVVVGAIGAAHRDAWRTGLVAPELVYTGELPDADVVALVQHARLSVFPSRNEGFGLPVAEAAACGVPAVCSGVTSMPEILDHPPACFDPDDPDAMAAVILAGLTDEAFRAELVAAGDRAARRWTWDRCAERAEQVWSGLVTRPRPRPAPRPRIALVGPFGGSPSGIGTYNERLLPALDRRAEVTCFVEQFWGEAPLGTDGRRYPVAALGRHIDPAGFDHVVYTLGNSPFHLSSVRLLRHVPGVTWFHEAQLAELHIGTAHLLRDQVFAEAFLHTRVARDHGATMVDALRDDAGWDGMLDVDRYHRLGVRLLGEVCDASAGVIVSSDVAAGLVRRHPPGFEGDVLVLPIAYPDIVPPPLEPATRPDVAVLGWLSPRKGLGQAIRVLARLRAEVPAARLVFIGTALDGSLEALQAALEQHGLAPDAAVITGFVPDAALGELLGRCSAGLRLADRTDGEMSAAVTELVAHGVPTVTNLASMGTASPGLQVLPAASDDELVGALRPLLTDPAAAAAARADARARAAAWGFDEVAERLLDWLVARGATAGLSPGSAAAP